MCFEDLRQPLYIVGAGDLGTDASTVDACLKEILSLVPKWNAILLIDEADVFLEQRGSDNLERNAVVAVFLREIEYVTLVLVLKLFFVVSNDPCLGISVAYSF